jgi:hypothetical protein
MEAPLQRNVDGEGGDSPSRFVPVHGYGDGSTKRTAEANVSAVRETQADAALHVPRAKSLARDSTTR